MTFNTSSNDWPVIKSCYQTHWKLNLIEQETNQILNQREL